MGTLFGRLSLWKQSCVYGKSIFSVPLHNCVLVHSTVFWNVLMKWNVLWGVNACNVMCIQIWKPKELKDEYNI